MGGTSLGRMPALAETAGGLLVGILFPDMMESKNEAG